MGRIVVNILALLISAFAAAITSLIVIRFYPLWALSVGVGEWSLWFILIALAGVALGFVAQRLGSRFVLPMTVALGLLTTGLALIPPLQSIPVARSQNVGLSLGRYLFGWINSPDPGTPETVTFAEVDGQALQLDVYRSQTTTEQPNPAIIVVHGGSWSGGRRSDFPQWNAWLTQQGYTVFDVDYRLQPQPNWREATGDVKCAIGWVRQHATQYNIDPDRLAILGRSAGGHLALLAAYTPGNPDLPPSCDVQDTRVRAVIDFYGPADLVWGYYASADPDGRNGSPALQRFLGGTPETTPDAYRIAAPINYVNAATPPTLIFHGGRDQLVGVPHSERLVARLEAVGVPHNLVYLPYAQHGFDYNFHGWGSQIAQPVILRFLEEAGVSSQESAVRSQEVSILRSGF